MNKTEYIDKLIDDAINSADDIKRAAPKPFLLTRIHARMESKSSSAWEKAGWFISRPAVAFTGLCMILLFNAIVLFNKTGNDKPTASPVDDYSYTVATIYDFENTQP